MDGFAFIELVAPCYRGLGRKNRFREDIDLMKYFEEMSFLDQDIDLALADLNMKPEERLVVGEFTNEEKPSYHKIKSRILKNILGGPK